jgi:hypothetical protein
MSLPENPIDVLAVMPRLSWERKLTDGLAYSTENSRVTICTMNAKKDGTEKNSCAEIFRFQNAFACRYRRQPHDPAHAFAEETE